jgi:hypothetical protein
MSLIVGKQFAAHLTPAVFDDYDEKVEKDLLEAAKVL